MEFDATFLFAAISFLVFVFLMNKIFYAPILKIMKDRQDFVAQNFNEAKNVKLKTQENIEYRESELQKSRSEAQEIIASKSQNLKKEKMLKIAEYKEELFGNIKTQKEELRSSALDAKEVLKDKVVDLAKGISDKLLGNNVNSDYIDKSDIKEENNG